MTPLVALVTASSLEPPVLSAFRYYRVGAAPSDNARAHETSRIQPTRRSEVPSRRAPVGPGRVEVVWRGCERHATRGVAVANGASSV